MYNSVPGLLEKRKANKLAKETASFSSSDVRVHSSNVDSNPLDNEKLKSNMLQNENVDLNVVLNDIVASNQLHNDNVQSNLLQNSNVDELYNDFKEMYQVSTFSFMQDCEVFDSLYICNEFNDHKQKKTLDNTYIVNMLKK